MQNLLLLQAMEVNVTEDHQEVKGWQASLFSSEVYKIIFHFTKVCTVEQDEMYSCFFFQKCKELTLTGCCRLAHSKVKDYMLRNALMLGAGLLTKVQGEA
eukprot:g39817.t1